MSSRMAVAIFVALIPRRNGWPPVSRASETRLFCASVMWRVPPVLLAGCRDATVPSPVMPSAWMAYSRAPWALASLTTASNDARAVKLSVSIRLNAALRRCCTRLK